MKDYHNKGLWNDVEVHLNNSCQLNCQHCYTSSCPSSKGWLSINLFAKLFPFITANPNRKVRLLGGEIIQNDFIFQYFKILKKKGVAPKVCSNGYNFKLWEKTFRNYFRFDEVILSCYGFETEHNAVTGIEDSFNNLMKTIKIIQLNLKSINNTAINTIITKYNYLYFIEFLSYLSSLKVDEIKILTLSPLGFSVDKEKSRYNKLLVPLKALLILKEKIIKKISDFYPTKVIIEPINKFYTHFECRIKNKTMLTIDKYGNVYPCHLMIGINDFIIGNLNKNDFSKIIFQYNNNFHQFFSHLKEKYQDKCPAIVQFNKIKKHKVKTETHNFCPLHLELLE